ncbi:HypC/HybG/HupF family hydrogenase formation chaperone [Natronobacterium gregoryi]|uniref:Hydrogenase assembly chaperone HypC/HupF n=2 Tax=Natronobacterium gregoryi TaxID=44930 RepID=L0AJI5_NATGS|nr:HypC/HybG/HupF family hydrogenase formation chaperone [Natronobacterium gregoryi]AFZ73342.1 hydrogenase assembly chaperone HypC/HupF [Natronobacterium gregoryi SP2]PLK18790.1 HypC/HybG/HupF family hydrogenase formation chaperone [Natronobacterium gregoryi SP2]SFJ63936.1 hydrogenase expression/formation protein HypC [Natronobacterium gregoryi]
MCLGIPGEILEINGDEARAEFWNVEKTVRLDIVGDTVEEGDYVLNHAGFAIRKIPESEVEETLEIYESFLEGDEDEALEELGAEDAVLEFGDRPTAVDGERQPVTADPGDRRSREGSDDEQ